jgi:hypothetical protein
MQSTLQQGTSTADQRPYRPYRLFLTRVRRMLSSAFGLGGTVLVVILWTGQAVAEPDQEATNAPPCSTSVATFDPSVDVDALNNYHNAIAQLLKEERFQELDCIADWARSSKARFSGGTSVLHNVYGGLAIPMPGHPTEEDWSTHLQLLERWNEQNPNSITVPIALAESYVNYGWNARGSGYSDTVSESGWRLFTERLAKAKAILDRASNKCPEWYVAMQEVAQGQGWEIDQLNALLERAVAFEPSYQYVYRAHATILLPKWQGEEGDAARFSEKAADRLGGDAGDILYFQVAAWIVCGCEESESTRFSWPRLQRGFAALERQYGPSLNNLNAFALLAVKAKDHVAADAAFKRIGENWDKDVWRTEGWFKSNRTLSAGLAPIELRNRTVREEARSNVRTEAGAFYQKDVLRKVDALEKPCLLRTDNDRIEFEFLVMVAADGNVLEIQSTPRNPVAECLRETLFAPHKTENAPFPQPPRDRYWVILDLDPNVINTAAK